MAAGASRLPQSSSHVRHVCAPFGGQPPFGHNVCRRQPKQGHLRLPWVQLVRVWCGARWGEKTGVVPALCRCYLLLLLHQLGLVLNSWQRGVTPAAVEKHCQLLRSAAGATQRWVRHGMQGCCLGGSSSKMGYASCSREGERIWGAAKRLRIRMGHPCGSAGGRDTCPVHAAAHAAWLCSSAAGLWRRRQQQQQGYQLFGTLSAVSWWEAVAWCGHVSEKGFGDLTMRVCCGCVAHCVYGVCACVVPPLSGFAAMQALLLFIPPPLFAQVLPLWMPWFKDICPWLRVCILYMPPPVCFSFSLCVFPGPCIVRRLSVGR